MEVEKRIEDLEKDVAELKREVVELKKDKANKGHSHQPSQRSMRDER